MHALLTLTLSLAAAPAPAACPDAAFHAQVARRENALGHVLRRPLHPAALGGLDRRTALAACFQPGTDPAYADAFHAWVIEQTHPAVDFFLGGSWGPGNVPTPAAVTYSFPSDNLGGVTGGITAQNQLNARFVQWFGSVAAGRNVVRSVFDRWQSLSGITFTEVPDDDAPWGAGGGPTRGDIRIVSINIDNPGGVLAFNFFPGPGNGGDMVLDATESYGDPSNNFRFFRNVFAHEVGHGIGLQHVCPANNSKLMEPFASTFFDTVQLDDLRGAQRNYGDFLENNDTPAGASALGLLTAPVAFNRLSIDDAGSLNDVDWFRVRLRAGTVTLRLTTNNGPLYEGYQQGANCPGGPPNVNPNPHDLELSLLAADGTTVLATSNNPGSTAPEAILAFPIPATNDYFVRVRATSTTFPSDVHTYDLRIEPVALSCDGDANGDNRIDFADLNLVLGTFGQSGSAVAGDVNRDGIVNFADLNIVLSNFGAEC